MVVERGWYASTDLWSPKLLDKFLFPHIANLAKVTHDHGKSYGYVMTTGIKTLGKRLVDAGVDVLYFIDPLADRITLEEARDQLSHQMTVVGGISSLTLSASKPEIEANVRHAMDVLGKTNRFILHPADSIFPDTSWEGLETLINTWKTYHKP
jgi:uroporphyrinogen-III decarboxylase